MASLEIQLQTANDQRLQAEDDLRTVRDLCVTLEQQKDMLSQRLEDSIDKKTQVHKATLCATRWNFEYSFHRLKLCEISDSRMSSDVSISRRYFIILSVLMFERPLNFCIYFACIKSIITYGYLEVI